MQAPAGEDPPSPAAELPRSRLNLVALLAALVTLDLTVGRMFLKLLPAEADLPNPALVRIVQTGHRFAGQLAAVLGWMVLVAALFVLGRRRYYRASTRLSLLFVGSVLAALVGIGLFSKIPGVLLLHLYLSFFFVGASVLLAILVSGAALHIRIGLVLLLVPAGVRYVVSINDRFATFLGWARRADLLPYVDGGLVVATALALLLLRPRRSHQAFALGLSLVVTAAAALLVRTHWDLAQRIAQYGFGLELPLQPWSAIAYCVAFGALLFVVTTHLQGDERDQLRAYGLLLLITNGLQLHWPSQLAIAAVGLLCLLESVTRPVSDPYRKDEIEELLRRAAVAAGASTVNLTGEGGGEAARLVGSLDGAPIEVVVQWRLGALASVDVTIASAPPRDPPFSLEYVEAPHLGPRADGPRLLLDDAELDAAFRVYDRRSVAAQLLDEQTRLGLLSTCRGWLAVWPQRGLRYRAKELARHPAALAETIGLLGLLWRRAA